MDIKAMLRERALRFLREGRYRGIRSPKPNDIFERISYISPDDLAIEGYLRRKPLAAFNPGAVLRDGVLQVFPRLVFEYYWYVSSIGFFTLSLKELEDKGPLPNKKYPTRIVIYPSNTWDMVGCEDARVVFEGGKYHILYTARKVLDLLGRYWPIQGYALLDENLRLISKKFFRVVYRSKSYLAMIKDSAFLEFRGSNVTMVTRPSIPMDGEENLLEIGWWGEVNLSTGEIELETLRPILPTEPWELKLGYSTNAVKLSSNEYLVGWHGVAQDYVYRNGLLIVSPEGELLGITGYILEPKGINEFYGDRPGVIFGDGLVLHKEYVYWIGGISDYAMAIFRTELDKVMEQMRWVKG